MLGFKLLAREVVGWKWLRHENILPFIGVTPDLAIVSDLMEHGNIMQFIANNPHHNRFHLVSNTGHLIPWPNCWDSAYGCDNWVGVFTQSRYRSRRSQRSECLAMPQVLGLTLIHQGNILVDSGCSARLADFGLAMIIDESTVGSTIGGHETRGTTRWMAPELLYPEHYGFPDDCQKRLPSKSTDIYALGMTILEVYVTIE